MTAPGRGECTALPMPDTGDGTGVPFRYFLQAEGVRGSVTSYGNNLEAGDYADTGDGRIYYEIYGQGEPLFVFHGGGV